jgi:hypothetical protein
MKSKPRSEKSARPSPVHPAPLAEIAFQITFAVNRRKKFSQSPLISHEIMQ